MKHIILICSIIILAYSNNKTMSLLCGYPNTILHVKDNRVYFKDGSSLLYDDKKTDKDMLNQADIEDTLRLAYPLFESLHVNPKTDVGRFRNEPFLHKLYGKDKKDVIKNLIKVKWLPKHTDIVLRFNKQQGAAKALELVSKELDELPKEYLEFIDNPSGTFNYRVIANTKRLSSHSFGISIDINTKKSNYWRWSKSKKYKNQIPPKIVHIFEKHGFIWGGRWKHFDTMHFEYRPELTCKNKNYKKP